MARITNPDFQLLNPTDHGFWEPERDSDHLLQILLNGQKYLDLLVLWILFSRAKISLLSLCTINIIYKVYIYDHARVDF